MNTPDVLRASRANLAAYGALAMAALFWAGNMLVGRAIHDMISPTVLSFWRWVLILVLLFPFVARKLSMQRQVLLRSWRTLAGLGLLSTGLFNSLVFYSLHHTTATNAALLNSTIPLWTVIAAWSILRDRISVQQALFLTTSFVGVGFIIARGNPDSLLSLTFNQGDAVMVFAMMLWGIYAVCLRYRPAGLGALVYLWVTGAIGLSLLFPVVCAEWAMRPAIISGQSFAEFLSPHSSTWSGIAYLAIFPSILATVLYNRSVDCLGAFRASQAIHLVPVFASLIAAQMLGESLQIYHLIGFALILFGLIGSELSRRV